MRILEPMFNIRIQKMIHFSVIGLLVLLAGCSDRVENSHNQSGQPVVALVMKSLANEFFVNMAEGAKNHQANSLSDEKTAYQLLVNGIKNESDLAQQVSLIDQMVAAGADAIVIAPADSKAIVPALARAINAGVVVVNIDNKLDAEVLQQYQLDIPFVGPDNKAGSYKVGKYLANHLDAGAQAAILEGIPSAFNSQQRRAGFEDALREAEIKVVSIQSAAWDQTKAADITSALLIKYPDLDAILCANDNMALGAASAIEQAGKSEKIRIVGFDNISAVRQLVGQGKILATADQQAHLLAVYGIEYAIEALQGNSTLIDRTTPVELVIKESID
ncbi:sugar ABC transporter substrate-binding protein [Porticoccus sp. W117]|uniref:sugar ABC transporter substrate-binding protein n=1 Tax=Porticoccus sp. W117 TaxID=3054777 RepID=UPI002595E37B|nr:sugar ABC transporter substrate-binding protein [Porticoccus sp. W117]MDM3872616.1 sugar ABC transporter substrate-binding protein [Porticoccus sp. W117]